MFALEGAEELEGSAPPRALTVGAAFICVRGRNIQDARKFAFVFVLHRMDPVTDARTTTRTQIGDLYAVLMRGTQALFDLAEQLSRRCPAWECERTTTLLNH